MCAVDLFGKYTWVVPLKDKKGIGIVNAFQKIISKGSKPSKMCLEEGCEFYNNLFKRFLKISNIEGKGTLHSACTEGKSVVTESFIRTLKNKIFKHITAVSKNVYIDVLDDIVNKYNNKVHITIKMKPIEVTSDSYDEYSENSNEKDSKFKVCDCVRISKYKNVFVKRYTQNGSEKVFVVSKIKNTVPWTYVISDLNGEPISGTFHEKELQKTNLEKLRIEKVIKKKGDKWYVTWKGYNNSFNS